VLSGPRRQQRSSIRGREPKYRATPATETGASERNVSASVVSAERPSCSSRKIPRLIKARSSSSSARRVRADPTGQFVTPMPEYLAPGVFIEEIERGPKPIEGVATSTAAFLGETLRGPQLPWLVTSYNECGVIVDAAIQHDNLMLTRPLFDTFTLCCLPFLMPPVFRPALMYGSNT
jgi:hypothetical protein